MYATNYFEQKMINLMRGSNITPASKYYLALYQSDPTDTGTAGTEISYSGYARREIKFNEPTSSGSGYILSNSEQITFPESNTSAGTVSHIGVLGSSSSGNMWLYGQLDTPLQIQNGVSPVFRAGSLKWIWSGNITAYYKQAIMNVLRGTTCNGFSPYIALCNGDPTGTGRELSGNNYARIAVTMSAPEEQVSGSCMSQNTSEVLSNIATGDWIDSVDTIAIYDASSNGSPFAVIGLGSSFSVLSGYQVGFHAGAVQMNVN